MGEVRHAVLQFRPEKSGKAGLAFLALARRYFEVL